MQHTDILIVGAGHAGAQAAAALRQNKFSGSIAIVGEETELPYERPPLSKEYFLGRKTLGDILLRAPAFWANHEIRMLLGQRVVGVDAAEHRVTTAAGTSLDYGTLIWATGGAPRRLACAGGDLSGVHSVRNRMDVDRMKSELADTRNVVVVGGGYIGLEAAAVLVQLGKSVTIVEVQDRVLARVAGQCLSDFYASQHRSRGVEVRLGTGVDRLVGEGGRVSGVALSDGTVLPAEMVIVGIGIQPAVEPLNAAGLQHSNGVQVDEFCRSALPDVFAIGDCAAHVNKYSAQSMPIRLESVQNANDQAKVVARFIAGERQPYDAVPWFWSDQYDLKLQTVGLSGGHDSVVVRGDPAQCSFSVVYLKQGRVLALDCVNAMKDYVQGKALIQQRAEPDAAALSDPAVTLKSLLPASAQN